jgi:AraC-like DNA-binding protein
MEKTYFSAFFREKIGVPFSQWLSRHRIERAVDLMKSRNYAISEVAARVGFQNLRTFERHFKRHTGQTPRDFERSVPPA